MNLGKKLIEIRKQNNMSQEEFAEIFNVTRQTISSWENSKSYPDIDTLVKISNRFNISLDTLLKEDGELVKEFDKKIKKGKKFNITILVIVLVFLAIIFVYLALINKDKYYPLKGVICTYENNFITQSYRYNSKGNPIGVGIRTHYGEKEEFREIFNKTTILDYYKSYKDIDDLVEGVKKQYEETGATCEVHTYEDAANANLILMQKYNEFHKNITDNSDKTEDTQSQEDE